MKPRLPPYPIVIGCMLFVMVAAPTLSTAADDDRSVSAGRWRVVTVEMNGKVIEPEIVSMLSVLYGADGTWAVFFKNILVAEGTSTIDPSPSPKSFEMKTRGSARDPDSGWRYSGIYEMRGNTRRLCVAPAGRPRPVTFSAARRTGQILVTLERIKTP